MKNPFRTRIALKSKRMFPKYLEIKESTWWCLIYRKWWQRKWHYVEMEDTGFGYMMPKFYNSKKAAIESVKKKIITEHLKNRIMVYSGEIGGKYNNVCEPTKGDEITLVTTDKDIIRIIQDNNLESVHPLEEFYVGGIDNLSKTDDFDWGNSSVSSVVEFIFAGKMPK